MTLSAPLSTRMKGLFLLGLVVAAVLGYVVGYSTAPSGAQQSITVMTWGGNYLEASKTIGAEFTKETGAGVNYILHAGGSFTALAKFGAEKPDYEADVYMAGEVPETQAMLAGYTIPITDLPSMSDIPDSLKIIQNGQVYGVAMYTTSTSWAYRTDLVTKPIDSWQSVLDPSFKGKLGIPTASFSARFLIGLALWKGGSEYNIDPGFQAAIDLAKGGYIGGLFSSDADNIRLLTTGQTPLVWSDSQNVYAAGQNATPVSFARSLSDGKVLVSGDFVGVLDTPKKDLAKKYVDLVISAQWNGMFSSTVGGPPSNLKATVEPKWAAYTIDPSAAYHVNATYVATVQGSWNQRWETEVQPLIHG